MKSVTREMQWFATVLCCWASDKRRCWLQVCQLTRCDEGCRNTPVTFKYHMWSIVIMCDPHVRTCCQHLATTKEGKTLRRPNPCPWCSQMISVCQLWMPWDLASPKGPVACLNSRAWAPDPQGISKNVKNMFWRCLEYSQVWWSIVCICLHIHIFSRHLQNIIIFVICVHNVCRPNAAGNELQQRSTDLQLQWGLYLAVLDCDYCTTQSNCQQATIDIILKSSCLMALLSLEMWLCLAHFGPMTGKRMQQGHLKTNPLLFTRRTALEKIFNMVKSCRLTLWLSTYYILLYSFTQFWYIHIYMYICIYVYIIYILHCLWTKILWICTTEYLTTCTRHICGTWTNHLIAPFRMVGGPKMSVSHTVHNWWGPQVTRLCQCHSIRSIRFRSI